MVVASRAFLSEIFLLCYCVGYKASKIGLVRDVSILRKQVVLVSLFYVLALGLLLCFSSKADGAVH